MLRFLSRVRWVDVWLGGAVCIGFLAEAVLLLHLIPTDIPGCESTAIFGCTDWTGLFLALLSVPLWYLAWVLLLRRRGVSIGWALATPVVVCTAAVRFAGLYYGPGARLLVPLWFILVAAAWSAITPVVPRSAASARSSSRP